MCKPGLARDCEFGRCHALNLQRDISTIGLTVGGLDASKVSATDSFLFLKKQSVLLILCVIYRSGNADPMPIFPEA